MQSTVRSLYLVDYTRHPYTIGLLLTSVLRMKKPGLERLKNVPGDRQLQAGRAGFEHRPSGCRVGGLHRTGKRRLLPCVLCYPGTERVRLPAFEVLRHQFIILSLPSRCRFPSCKSWGLSSSLSVRRQLENLIPPHSYCLYFN